MTKRKLIYVPQINPDTFLLFFHKGTARYSYSLRDYSTGTLPKPTKSKYPADEILLLAEFCFDAPAISIEKVAFWCERINALNTRYLHTRHHPRSPEDHLKAAPCGNEPQQPVRNMVQRGSRVTIRFDDDDEPETYYIHKSRSSNPDDQIISDASPLGSALLQARPGERRTYMAPDGMIAVTVVEVVNM